jgi:hypothetical protein
MSLRSLSGVPANDLGRAVAADGAGGDDQLEQVRELLFGEQARRNDERLAAIEQRLTALEARFDALAREHAVNRAETIDQIARGIVDLGEHVRRIGKP